MDKAERVELARHASSSAVVGGEVARLVADQCARDVADT